MVPGLAAVDSCPKNADRPEQADESLTPLLWRPQKQPNALLCTCAADAGQGGLVLPPAAIQLSRMYTRRDFGRATPIVLQMLATVAG